MTGTKRRVTPVRLTEPRTVAISLEDYQQAVTALASMIEQWWQYNALGEHLPQCPDRCDPIRAERDRQRVRRYAAQP